MFENATGNDLIVGYGFARRDLLLLTSGSFGDGDSVAAVAKSSPTIQLSVAT